jgi:translation elongation factor 1 epsilon-1
MFVYPSATDKYVASTMLKELNEYLAKRSFLVKQTLTLADLAVYYAIENTMVS